MSRALRPLVFVGARPPIVPIPGAHVVAGAAGSLPRPAACGR